MDQTIQRVTVCWRCKQGGGKDRYLLNVKKDQLYKKTNLQIKVKTADYICTKCQSEGFYFPDTSDSSKIARPIWTPEQLARYKELIQDSEEAAHPSTTQILEEKGNTQVVVEKVSEQAPS